MIVLAADTSTSLNTVAVCSEGRVLAETVAEVGRKHSERLLATVDWVLREGGLSLSDVEMLAVSRGPGSFTGLRIGVAAFKGLALGRDLPLMGVPTLDAMSRLGAFSEILVCPLLDARMDEVFGAAYRFEQARPTKVGVDRVCGVEAFVTALDGDALFLGDGARLYRERITAAMPGARFAPAEWAVPRASTVAAEALHRLERGEEADADAVAPVYLRRSQAEELRAEREQAAP